MKKYLWLALSSCLLLVTACSSSTTEEIEVNGEKVASIFKVIGQKEISETTIVYKAGSLSETELINYIAYLKEEEGFSVIKEQESEGRAFLRLGKPSDKTDHMLWVDIDYHLSGDEEVTLTYHAGDEGSGD